MREEECRKREEEKKKQREEYEVTLRLEALAKSTMTPCSGGARARRPWARARAPVATPEYVSGGVVENTCVLEFFACMYSAASLFVHVLIGRCTY